MFKVGAFSTSSKVGVLKTEYEYLMVIIWQGVSTVDP